MGTLPFLNKGKTRSISPENVTGEKGKGGMATEGVSQNCARDLGHGWKISPYFWIPSKETMTIADIEGPGVVQQIWMTTMDNLRYAILRIYWDDSEHPSVECPLGDFFACGWGRNAQISSLAICVNPGSALNCYWQMPFRRRCRITLENLSDARMGIFYQINYELREVPQEAAYFHAQFRRVNPLPFKQPYVILDGVEGWGHYVGTYMCWGVNNRSWWGEGEIKFFMDGDTEFPTICGTGTEDYFGGSYNFENKAAKRYQEFTTPYVGLPQVIRPDGLYDSQMRFGMYRWHIMDPVRFERDLKVTMQALGWHMDKNGRYLPLRDDISSVAYWYQTHPGKPFPPFPSRDDLEVI